MQDERRSSSIENDANRGDGRGDGWWREVWAWFGSPEGAKGWLIRAFIVFLAVGVLITPFTDEDGGEEDIDADIEGEREDQTGEREAEGGHQIFSDSFSGSQGLTVGVSERGSLIGFGLDDGDVLLYDESGSSEPLETEVQSPVSHLKVSKEARQINLAWVDTDLLGAITTHGDELWAYELEGLWDVSSNPQMDVTAAVSDPEGPGVVGYAVNGEVRWTEDLDDASGYTVAVSDSGDHVAVALQEYWAGGDEAGRSGTPGVALYNDEGERLWQRSTETDVIGVGIDEEQGRLVAGTDDGNLLVLGLEGDIVWEEEEAGGWLDLSSDGTIITSQIVGISAYDIDGEHLWDADVPGMVGEDFVVSDEGGRVLAFDRGQAQAALVETGDIIWTEEYGDGPIGGGLSSDGTTWAIIQEDLDDRAATVYAYRNEG